MLPDFVCFLARTEEEAISLLSAHPRAALLAGGTDLLIRMKKGETHPCLVDITRVPQLSAVAVENNHIRIGACATHRRVATEPVIASFAPSLSAACSWVGSPQIRNMGTIGGNIVNASPAADSIPPLLIHDAILTIESHAGRKSEPLEKFILAPYKTEIGEKEILSSVTINALQGYQEGYKRVAKRAALAISRLGVAWAFVEKDGIFLDVRLAIGSCTPMPFRPRNVEAFLKGRKREKSVVEEAVTLCLDEIRRVSGERPSFVYKLPVVRDLLRSILGGR
jgi:CO/xanthine dehydrogenase FAD-binding subunit